MGCISFLLIHHVFMEIQEKYRKDGRLVDLNIAVLGEVLKEKPSGECTLSVDHSSMHYSCHDAMVQVVHFQRDTLKQCPQTHLKPQ